MTDTPQQQARPRRFALFVVVAGALLLLGGGAFFGLADQQNSKDVAHFLGPAVGGPFRLADQNGKPFTEADLKGKWSLIFFGFTHCADTCPTTLNEMSQALDQLGKERDRVRIVFISVDAERDTPEVLKSYVSSFGSSIVALTGTADEIKQAAKVYRVYYAKHPLAEGGYDMDHSAVIYVMNPEGRFTATLTPEAPAAEMVARLKKLLS